MARASRCLIRMSCKNTSVSQEANAQGCGFPTAHWLAMMHAGTGMITKMLAAPLRTHDLAKTAELHPELRANDVLVADRGFCSFAHFALLLQRGTHGVLRIHQRLLVDFTPGRTHTVPGKGKSCGKKGLPRSRLATTAWQQRSSCRMVQANELSNLDVY